MLTWLLKWIKLDIKIEFRTLITSQIWLAETKKEQQVVKFSLTQDGRFASLWSVATLR